MLSGMNSTNLLRMIAARIAAKRQEISQLSLTQWIELAGSLAVPMNDRDHAAKKLALRELRAEGKLA